MALAAVTGAHGLDGEVRLKLFADDLVPYTHLWAGQRRLAVTGLRASPGTALVRFAGIDDRNAAEALRGTLLEVPRAALPPLGEGEYYHADLIGLACVDRDGAVLGRVIAVDNFGAGDVIEIERPDGGRFMVPMHPDAVPEWNTERLVVDAVFVI